MGTSPMTYRDQLLHPNWQRRRLERLAVSGWGCERCEDTDSPLHVHHRRYVKGRMAWDYDDDDLQVLCEACHKQHHAAHDLLEAVIASSELHVITGDEREPAAMAAALLAGYLCKDTYYGMDEDEKSIGAARDCEPRLFAIGRVAGLLAWFMDDEHIPALTALLRTMVRDAHLPVDKHVQEDDVARWFGRN